MTGRGRGPRPWLAALAGGIGGTAAMTVALAAETRLRPDSGGPVDYDTSDHVVVAACTVLHRPVPRSGRARRRIFNLVHWGYGSAVALEYEAIRRRTDHPAVWFYVSCQTTALVLFPTLGGTPAPWRWKRELLLSSFGVHAIYVAVVAATSRRLSAR